VRWVALFVLVFLMCMGTTVFPERWVAFSHEVISDMSEKSLPVLNDELRKLRDSINTLERTVENLSTTVGPADLEDGDYGFFSCASGVCATDNAFLSTGATYARLTIASGAVTVTKSINWIDTEGGAATDDLDTINGGAFGDIIIVKSASNVRDTTLKDGVGNLGLAGDFTLSNVQDFITLIKHGTNWYELSRADNA
jgi:hypothetical protein